MSTEPSAVDELYCPGCGYNLFGIDSEKCPECGLTIDRTGAGASQLPWTHRRQIGRVRAFFKTAILASFRPKKLAQEMNRPVSYTEARKFRYVCVILAWLATTAGGIVLAIENDCLGKDSPASLIEQIVGIPLTAASIGLFFLAIISFPSLFFHPAQLSIPRQNRAIALSFYSASAPWLGLWIWGMVAAVTLPFVDGAYPTPLGTFVIVGVVLVYVMPLVLTLFMIAAIVRLLKHTTHCGLTRQIAAALAMPFAWVSLFAIIVVGIPLAMFYAAVIFFSLQMA